jgi:hypothetical protein
MNDLTPLRVITVGDIAHDFFALVVDEEDRRNLIGMALTFRPSIDPLTAEYPRR